ncbi:hypothetical protein P355_2177 [Burkholderia cenocepacia KC-01]|nr:hypothetical protein P355_2177 [Burkholderia cenocepacia KC-01]
MGGGVPPPVLFSASAARRRHDRTPALARVPTVRYRPPFRDNRSLASKPIRRFDPMRPRPCPAPSHRAYRRGLRWTFACICWPPPCSWPALPKTSASASCRRSPPAFTSRSPLPDISPRSSPPCSRSPRWWRPRSSHGSNGAPRCSRRSARSRPPTCAPPQAPAMRACSLRAC